MKQVNDLEKPCRRRYIWLDRDGALWFWDSGTEEWGTLEGYDNGWWSANTNGDDEGWPDAPFTRLLENKAWVE